MGRRVFGSDYWNKLLKWNQMARDKNSIVMVFTSSMADNFEKHPITSRELEKLWSYIRKTPNIHYQVLTKRAERIRECLPEDWYDYRNGYPNVWLGVSVESNEVAYRFNDHLADIPAAVRFVSYEPAIGPLTDIRWEQLDWLIVGGESGPKRRPFEHDWARYVHQQCRAHGVGVFYKQDTALRSSSNPYLDGKKYYEFPSPRA
jgi:protein gp37